jgi:uroporphyrinogen-III decarboxylase
MKKATKPHPPMITETSGFQPWVRASAARSTIVVSIDTRIKLSDPEIKIHDGDQIAGLLSPFAQHMQYASGQYQSSD